MEGESIKRLRALSCFILALCLLFYAVPRLPLEQISEAATGFSLIWTSFALLVIGANLMYVIETGRKEAGKHRRHPALLLGVKDGQRKKLLYKGLR